MSRRSFLNRSAAAGGAVALSPYFSRARKGEVTIQFAALIDQTGEQTHEIEQSNRLHAGKIKVEYVQLPPVATDQYS
jgi:multiple sugar transport system substrate-binding protein